jgi:hypothetical protein
MNGSWSVFPLSPLQDLDEEVILRETQDWLILMRYIEIKASRA